MCHYNLVISFNAKCDRVLFKYDDQDIYNKLTEGYINIDSLSLIDIDKIEAIQAQHYDPLLRDIYFVSNIYLNIKSIFIILKIKFPFWQKT